MDEMRQSFGNHLGVSEKGMPGILKSWMNHGCVVSNVQTLAARVGCRGDPWVEWPGFEPESVYLEVPMARKCRAVERGRPALLQHCWGRGDPSLPLSS